MLCDEGTKRVFLLCRKAANFALRGLWESDPRPVHPARGSGPRVARGVSEMRRM